LLLDNAHSCILEEFEDQRVDSAHFLNAEDILFLGTINLEVDLVLLDSLSNISSNALLLLGNETFLLDSEFIVSLLLNGSYALLSMSSDELDHGVQDC